MSLLTITPQVNDDLESYNQQKQKAAREPTLEEYNREKRINAQVPGIGRAGSLLRGALQGVSLGWGDEMAAAHDAGQKYLAEHPEYLGVPDAEMYALANASPEHYAEKRTEFREQDEAARRAHKGLYVTGEVAGGAVPAAALTVGTGGGGGPASAMLQGATAGAGYSDADTLGGVAADSAVGAGLGLLGDQAGQVASKGLRGLAGLAKSKAAAAAGRAATQAGTEVDQNIGSLSGKYGGEVQKGSRYVENLMRLEQSMTPEQRALYQQLQASGVVPNLQHQVAQGTLEALPGQADTIASAKQTLLDAIAGRTKAVADRTAALSQPQIGADVASFAKAYAEPLVAATIAPPGMKTAAGVIFGRTRAGKALMSRVNRPGNQIALWNTVGKAAELPLGAQESPYLSPLVETARDKALDSLPDEISPGDFVRKLLHDLILQRSVEPAVRR